MVLNETISAVNNTITTSVAYHSDRFVYFLPNWALFTFVAVVGFFIYYNLPEDLKHPIKQFIKRFGMFIILACFYLYYKDRWGLVSDDPYRWPANISYASFIVGFGVLLWFSVANWLYEQRYQSTPFQANGVYGSCARYFDVGKYTIFYLGTSGKSSWKGFIFPWYFAEKICVVPKVSWDFNGEGIVSIAQVSKMALNRLPPRIKKMLLADALTYFAREDIYFGLFSEPLRTDDPQISEIENEMTLTNSKFNTLEENFDDVTTNEEKYLGHLRRAKILNRAEQQPQQAPQRGSEE